MLEGVSEASATVRTWSPKTAALIAAGGGGLLAAAVAVLSGDPSGRLLVGLAAVGLLATATAGTLLRPRLAVDRDGLTVRGLAGRRRVIWSELAQWEVVTHHRLGRRVAVLELTVLQADKEALLLFTSTELGEDPRDVLEALQQVRQADS